MLVGGWYEGDMRSGDTTDRPENRMFNYHNLTVPRESVQEVWIAPVFSTVNPLRVKSARLLANGVPVPDPIDIGEVK